MTNSEIHVLIVPAWMPKASDPAAGSFIVQQAIALQQTDGVQVGLIFLDSEAVPVEKKKTLDVHRINYVIRKVSYIPKVSKMLIRRWCQRYYRVYEQYKTRHGEPDIIHAHSYVAGFAASYISKQSGIPFVLTEHSTNFLYNNVRRLHVHTVKETLDEASWIIAVGAELAKAMQDWTEQAIEQIPNPIDPDIFYHDPGTEKSERFTLVAVGALIPRKRIHLILEAMSMMETKDVRLICIGSGSERKKLKKRARTLGLRDRITWHRFLPPREIAKVMRKAHLLVSTSDAETFGIVVGEALMCGIPVLCTASGGPEEFVNEQCGQVVPVEISPKEIASTLDDMIVRYDQYGPENNAAHAAAQFSRHKVIERILGGYRKINNNSV